MLLWTRVTFGPKASLQMLTDAEWTSAKKQQHQLETKCKKDRLQQNMQMIESDLKSLDILENSNHGCY